jgi:hypothetical protein
MARPAAVAWRAIRGIGLLIGGSFVILWWLYWFVSPFWAPFVVYRVPAENEYSAQEVVALDGFISCMSYRDWYVTAASGPCGDFEPPPKIAVGSHFRARGTDYEIHIILATHVDEDSDDEKFPFKKGDWYCEVAQSESDLDHRGREWRRTWLFVPKCHPVR